MTLAVIAANSITVGSPFTFAASGDSLIVLENVTLGSTGGTAISVPVSEVEVTVLGTLVSAAQITLSSNSSFTLGTDGSFVCSQASAALERIALEQVHLFKGDTQINQRLACLGSPSI